MTSIEIGSLSNAELIAVFNYVAEKPVKRFENRPTGEARTLRALDAGNVTLADVAAELGIIPPPVLTMTVEDRAEAAVVLEVREACGQDRMTMPEADGEDEPAEAPALDVTSVPRGRAVELIAMMREPDGVSVSEVKTRLRRNRVAGLISRTVRALGGAVQKAKGSDGYTRYSLPRG